VWLYFRSPEPPPHGLFCSSYAVRPRRLAFGGRKRTPSCPRVPALFLVVALYKALLFCGLLAACLSLTASARAGSWSGPAYAFSGTDGNGKPWKWPVNSGTYNNPNSPGYSASGSASGTVTATFTWTPDPNNPSEPPTPLCVLEKGYANAGGGSGLGADDGLGDAATGGPTFPTSQGSHLTLAGTTSPVVLTHTLSDTCPNGIGEMTYQATGYPVTLGLGGTTPGSDGSANILIGQKCTGSLSGGGGTLSGWQWSVGGTTFQTWSDTAPTDTEASYYVDGPGPLDQPTASWYWNDLMGSGATKNETVSCTATVTPPTGEGDAFTVSATKQVTVYRPVWTATGTGGEMLVDVNRYDAGGDIWLWAAPATMGETGGMVWNASVFSPAPGLFENGTIQIVQLVIPGMSYTAPGIFGIASTHNFPQNGQEGLDGSFPYGWVTGPVHEPTGDKYFAGDAPGLDLISTNARSATVTDQFEDYLMYEPPGSFQYIPLAHFVWSTNGSATIPATGNWADWSGSAGSITPSGSAKPFPQSNSFPMWTQIITVSDF